MGFLKSSNRNNKHVLEWLHSPVKFEWCAVLQSMGTQSSCSGSIDLTLPTPNGGCAGAEGQWNPCCATYSLTSFRVPQKEMRKGLLHWVEAPVGVGIGIQAPNGACFDNEERGGEEKQLGFCTPRAKIKTILAFAAKEATTTADFLTRLQMACLVCFQYIYKKEP